MMAALWICGCVVLGLLVLGVIIVQALIDRKTKQDRRDTHEVIFGDLGGWDPPPGGRQ